VKPIGYQVPRLVKSGGASDRILVDADEVRMRLDIPSGPNGTIIVLKEDSVEAIRMAHNHTTIRHGRITEAHDHTSAHRKRIPWGTEGIELGE
jgi:hypothetical protein